MRSAKKPASRSTDIAYFGSQPWPFPNSLMLGFHARWAGGDICVDGDEIVDAQWFAHDDLPMIPPGMSIARQLIDDWIARCSRRLTPIRRGPTISTTMPCRSASAMDAASTYSNWRGIWLTITL